MGERSSQGAACSSLLWSGRVCTAAPSAAARPSASAEAGWAVRLGVVLARPGTHGAHLSPHGGAGQAPSVPGASAQSVRRPLPLRRGGPPGAPGIVLPGRTSVMSSFRSGATRIWHLPALWSPTVAETKAVAVERESRGRIPVSLRANMQSCAGVAPGAQNPVTPQRRAVPSDALTRRRVPVGDVVSSKHVS